MIHARAISGQLSYSHDEKARKLASSNGVNKHSHS